MTNKCIDLGDQYADSDLFRFRVVRSDEVVIEWCVETRDEDSAEMHCSSISFEPKTIRQMAEFLAQFSFCSKRDAPIHRSEAEHVCAEPEPKSSFIDEGEIPF